MDAKFNHHLVEEGKFQKWVDKKYFSTHEANKKPFSIVLPPPNVTGILHIGHALNSYISDSVIRYKKMSGYDVLFLPSMDHAGIATQIKVEADLATKGISKHDISRADFLKAAFKWKDDHADIIKQQWGKLGIALDFSSERFTLDKPSNEAVNKVFIKWFQDGIIYRDYKGISWDVELGTTLSNIELDTKDIEQDFYYIKYPLKDEEGYVVIATVRPETLYSDVALVYNPHDKRFKHLANKKIIHPLLKTELKVLTDEYVDPNFGTGMMKLSAHDANDIDIIKARNLEVIESIDNQGFLTSQAQEFAGLDRMHARQEIVKKLRKENYLQKVEKTISAINYSSRTGAQIEILAKKQWFVKMDLLRDLVLKDLEQKETVKFYPKRFAKEIKRWMNNVHDWPISRQLIWGHQIPAWYKDDEIKVQLTSPGPGWHQDEDVLDTWFSSGIAVFSFFGWPKKTMRLKRFFPSSLMVTGYDIIFFWVARMYFTSLYFMKERPFQEVLLNGLIRDEQKRKMSKSIGNGINPMDVIEEYGSDALRWLLLTNSSPGLDFSYSTIKVRSAWNLQNKLWNISRYILSLKDQTNELTKYDKWIQNRFYELVLSLDKHIQKYEFTLIGKSIQKFIIEEFSGSYLEISKVFPNPSFAKKLLHDFLILVHPYMPFISDYLMQEAFHKEVLEESLLLLVQEAQQASKEGNDVQEVIQVISKFRELRQSNHLQKAESLKFSLKNSSFSLKDIKIIEKLAKAKYYQGENNFPIELVISQQILNVDLPSSILNAQKKLNQEQSQFLEFEIARAQKILANEGFLKKAPQAKIAAERAKLIQYQEQLKELLDD